MERKNLLIGIIVFLIFLMFNISVFRQIINNYSKKENIQNEILKIEEKISETDLEIKKYDKFIASLQNKFEQEKIARNKLKMVKSNEVIYKLIKKK